MKDSLSLIQEIASELMGGFVSKSNEEEKVEVQEEVSQEVSDAGDEHNLEVDGDSEEDIERLEAEIAKLSRFLAEQPDLYQTSPVRFRKATEAIAERQAALQAAEEEWLTLEEKAD